jgi:mRNA deadenylase 3'-5' endonuclease subunit Ccr4
LADTFAYSRPFQAKNVVDNIVTIVPEHLKWNFRKDMIGSAIQNCAADILCLQEVDHYDDFYEPFLSNIGYSTIYLQRPKRKDGCLIAYKKDNFELSAVEEIQFDDIVDFMPSDSARSNVKRSNVALIALLTNKLKPENAFVISTAHLYWNERRKEVKKMQTQYLYGRVESFLSSNALPEQTPVVIAGDFNSIPLSEPYQVL